MPVRHGVRAGQACLVPADQWIEEAQRLLLAVGYEADFADAAVLAEMVVRGLFAGIGAVKRAVVRYPLPTTGIMLGVIFVVWLCLQRGWLTTDRLRGAGRQVAAAAKPLAETIGTEAGNRVQARSALTIARNHNPATVEERRARYLAGCRPAMTSAELRDARSLSGDPVSAAAIRRR